MSNEIRIIESRKIFRTFTFLLLLPFIFLLASCSTTRAVKQDGPPNFYVDETKIPNATPKMEKPAKYGNMSSYRVFGKRYYTLKSSKNYDARGIASWYGTKFHAQRTSSGERYDMLAMTAAHKSLPLPTYVEVTNLANKRKIIVKVNDRGPFMGDRIIDLSYVAAKKLGMANRGTAYVRVRAINPKIFGHEEEFMLAEEQPRKKFHLNFISPNKHNRFVYLQVGTFRNKLHAIKMQKRLASKFSTPVKISKSSQKKSLYRVRMGPFKDIVKAEELTQQLQNLGIKPNKSYGA
jgi:rare lipoprotein A